MSQPSLVTNNGQTTVSFNDAKWFIETFGDQHTVLLRGTPGIGKSAILHSLANDDRFKDTHNVGYIDCANLDLGDIAMPLVDSVKMVTNYAPNARFKLHEDKPVIIMLDELGKATPSVMNMLLPLIHEHRLGDLKAKPGSMFFATTNLESDGVGDRIPAHAYNRMTTMTMRGPTVKEWQEWANSKQLAHELLALVEVYPQMLAQYTEDGAGSNPYIFNPRTGNTKAYVSPRSLAALSSATIQLRQGSMNEDRFRAWSSGTVGVAAADCLITLTRIGSTLPRKHEVIRDPKGSMKRLEEVESLSAYHLLASALASDIQSEDEMKAIAEFMFNLPQQEARFLYQNLVVKNPALFKWHRASVHSTKMSSELANLLT